MRFRFDLAKVRDWLDAVLKLLSILALLVGGVWAVYQWRITDSAALNVQISTSAEVLPYRPGFCLVVLHAKPKNIGKVPVDAAASGLPVVLKVLPPGLQPGVVSVSGLTNLHPPVNAIEEYMKDGYTMEPGVEYDEIVTEVVPVGGVYLARAELSMPDNTEVDQSTVRR